MITTYGRSKTTGEGMYALALSPDEMKTLLAVIDVAVDHLPDDSPLGPAVVDIAVSLAMLHQSNESKAHGLAGRLAKLARKVRGKT